MARPPRENAGVRLYRKDGTIFFSVKVPLPDDPQVHDDKRDEAAAGAEGRAVSDDRVEIANVCKLVGIAGSHVTAARVPSSASRRRSAHGRRKMKSLIFSLTAGQRPTIHL